MYPNSFLDHSYKSLTAKSPKSLDTIPFFRNRMLTFLSQLSRWARVRRQDLSGCLRIQFLINSMPQFTYSIGSRGIYLKSFCENKTRYSPKMAESGRSLRYTAASDTSKWVLFLLICLR